MNFMLGPLREGIMTVLFVAGPIILAAAILGLTVGILQAATQIQDQTIPSAFKLIAVLLLLFFLGIWMFTYVKGFTLKTISRAFALVIRERQPVLEPSNNLPKAQLTNNLTAPKMPLPSFQTSDSIPTGNNFKPLPPTFAAYAGSQAPAYSVNNPNPTNQAPINPTRQQSSTYQSPSISQNSQSRSSQNIKVPAKAIAPKVKKPSRPKTSYSNKNKVILDQPMQISIKPKLPNTQINNTPYNSTTNPAKAGDQLPKPNNSSAEWW